MLELRDGKDIIQDANTYHQRQYSRAYIHCIGKDVWISSVFGRGDESEGRDFGEQARSGRLITPVVNACLLSHFSLPYKREDPTNSCFISPGLETLIFMRGNAGILQPHLLCGMITRTMQCLALFSILYLSVTFLLLV